MTKRCAVLSLLLTLSACASSGSYDSPGTTGNGGFGTAGSAGSGIPGTTGTAGATGTAGTGGTAPPLPPEVEVESSFEVPVATGHFIWVANPQSGRVAYVDASTLEVHTVEAGNAPTYMSPIPGAVDAVIVLNVLSDDATVLSVGAAGLESRTIRGVAHGANALAVSANGGWAIAWTDARRVKNAAANDGYQDLTVINLDPLAAKPKTIVTAGFRPVSVAFAADGRQAFAVTEDGITVVELTGAAGPRVSKNVIITDDPTENADTRDVSLTTGGLAIVRREGSAAIGIVDLATSARTSITLSGPVTDLDVTSDGRRAVAVVRNTAEVAILPLDGGVPTAATITRVTITGEVVGSVALAPGGGAALLYSNAATLERLTVLTLGATPSYRVVKLHAPVLSVFAAADAANAVVVHADDTPPAPVTGAGGSTARDGGAGGDGGTNADPDAEPDAGAPQPPGPRPGRAFSLVPLANDLPAKIQTTDAPPESVVLSPDGSRALLTIRDDVKRVYAVYMGLFPTLEVQRFGLASPPIAAGVVAAAGRGYVAQKHPEGRITFVTLESGEARTLTGFELGSRVVDWTQP